MNNVIPLLDTIHASYKVMILEPTSLDQRITAIQALQESKVVILKLHNLDHQQAQRLLDFVCGSAYAIASQPLQLSEALFLFVPHSIQLRYGDQED